MSSVARQSDYNTPIEAARAYLTRGWRVVPAPYRQKRPVLDGWPNLQLTEADLPQHFGRGPVNLGVLLGEPSGGLVDIDLDSPEARALAPEFLPETRAVFGRAGKRRSHWLYIAEPAPASAKFQGPDKQGPDQTVLVELRSIGLQMIFPPSVHPSGERVTWESDGEPARVDGETLVWAVQRLAGAALLARHWPARGARQDFALALAGALLRAGWSDDEAAGFIEAVARAVGDDEVRRRASTVAYTARRLEADWPRDCQPWSNTWAMELWAGLASS